jgi:hypothetical protein
MSGNQFVRARAHLVDAVRRELLGPGSEMWPSGGNVEDELITSLPEVRYSVGILFPRGNCFNVDNDDARTMDNREQRAIDDGVRAEDDASSTDESESSLSRESGHDDNSTDDTDVGTLDEEIGLAAQVLPSSMGFTFFVSEDISTLTVDVGFGTYRRAGLSDCCLELRPEDGDKCVPDEFSSQVEYDPNTRLMRLVAPLRSSYVHSMRKSGHLEDADLAFYLYRLCDQYRYGFVRQPSRLRMKVSLNSSCVREPVPNPNNLSLELTCIKKPCSRGLTAVTVMLVNMERGGYDGTNSVLQARLTVESEANGISFAEYSHNPFASACDDEESTLNLLYRAKKVYATGHGTSVDWDVDASGTGSVWTEYLPTVQVAQMDFSAHDDMIPGNVFSMKYLSDLDSSAAEDKLNALSQVVKAYRAWIEGIEAESRTLDAQHVDAAERHVNWCRECADRMTRGLTVLRTDDKAFAAFSLANRAMYMQRIHSAIQSVDSYPGNRQLQDRLARLDYCQADTLEPNGEPPAWRPFQLAFLLMSLHSIVVPMSAERDLVDLIWFPTGGGKTEAYLGLTAFTIFYRRLAYPGRSAGTAVIMRYTLRLLASQQFTRASILICACEAIRRDCARGHRYPVYPLGPDPITIGLWIGGSHTPNKSTGNDSAKSHLQELLKATPRSLREAKNRHNRFQVLKCPWCGTKLVKDSDSEGRGMVGQWGYGFADGHFYVRCTQEGCPFENRLPIQVVDEELYRQPPTLLFGTVDKFAMVAWKRDSGSFFGGGGEARTPELIIQDELHLISGPLGTMVGLYETAIDALCGAKGCRPKIIASTATIRRAKAQCSALYNREVRQFPPPGLDAADSYFAKEADPATAPGRLYIGVMPAGKTKAMMEVRIMSAILQHVYMMPYADEVRDKYWTLTGYFNSLRDLGKCSTLVSDDIKDSIRRMTYRLGRWIAPRPIWSASELTSRVSTTQLNETLDRLEHVAYSSTNQQSKKYPVSVLLATNMISVGVDVDRLNVMLVVGQPKLTSEYVQASSRIGRKYPGVAFTLYDGSKSRDRSHYEQFRAYHDSFYRYVEPTVVTPFSKPARDRAMHAVAIALARHLYGLSADADAGNFDLRSSWMETVEDYIVNRVQEASSRSGVPLSGDVTMIREELRAFWNEWGSRLAAAGKENFCYGDRYIVEPPTGDARRLIKAFGNGGSDVARETPTSMRNVDQSVVGNIIVWEAGK